MNPPSRLCVFYESHKSITLAAISWKSQTWEHTCVRFGCVCSCSIPRRIDGKNIEAAHMQAQLPDIPHKAGSVSWQALLECYCSTDEIRMRKCLFDVIHLCFSFLVCHKIHTRVICILCSEMRNFCLHLFMSIEHFALKCYCSKTDFGKQLTVHC